MCSAFFNSELETQHLCNTFYDIKVFLCIKVDKFSSQILNQAIKYDMKFGKLLYVKIFMFTFGNKFMFLFEFNFTL